MSSAPATVTPSNTSILESKQEKKAVRVLLIRHAQSQANVDEQNMISGQSNSTPLSSLGIKQSGLLGSRLKHQGIKFDMVYTSTAIRTKETAKLALAQTDYQGQVVSLDDLLEQSQGQWEGVERSKAHTQAVQDQMAKLHWKFIPPGGESFQMVEERAFKCFQKLVDSHFRECPPKKTIAIFSHGGTIRCILHGILQHSPDLTWRFGQNNTGITELFYDIGGWSFVRMNDIAHLLDLPK